jgi:hypothetical protein
VIAFAAIPVGRSTTLYHLRSHDDAVTPTFCGRTVAYTPSQAEVVDRHLCRNCEDRAMYQGWDRVTHYRVVQAAVE